jgi:putative membrane protein
VQWWCAARGVAWTWTWVPYPGVWVFIAALAVYLVRRNAGGTTGTRRAALAAGLVVLWLALDWPLGALGSGYLASVHMLQFLLVAQIAPPLLLRGLSPAAFLALRQHRALWRVVEFVTRPVPALLFYSAIVVATHLPPITDALMTSQLGSFAIDLAWLLGGLVLWWPVVAPLPERPRFVHPLKIGYLMLGIMFSPVNIGLSAFLVYSPLPLYRTFELAPPLPGVASHDDQQVAGLLMSVGSSFIAMAAVSVLFFRWAKATA